MYGTRIQKSSSSEDLSKLTVENQPLMSDGEYEEEVVSNLQESIAASRPFTVWLVYVLSIADIAVFVWEIIENNGFEPWIKNPLFGPTAKVLDEMGAKWAPLILEGQVWRLLVPLFLHAGIIHLILNLIIQFQVGRDLEATVAWWRFAIIYVASGIIGNVVSCVFLPRVISVGASGSLFGIFGALFAQLLILWKAHPSPLKALVVNLISLAISLVLGLMPMIDNFCHLGGLFMGFFLGLALIPSTPLACTNTHRITPKLTSGHIVTIVGVILSVALTISSMYALWAGGNSQSWCSWCGYLNCVNLIPGQDWCLDFRP